MALAATRETAKEKRILTAIKAMNRVPQIIVRQRLIANG